MSMSRKDYQLIADSFAFQLRYLNANKDEAGADVLCCFAEALANDIRRENSNFDKQKFLAAAIGKD